MTKINIILFEYKVNSQLLCWEEVFKEISTHISFIKILIWKSINIMLTIVYCLIYLFYWEY
jgi:hypothetical protein